MADDATPKDPTVARARDWRRRVLALGLAIAAITFIAWVVPIRDRCDDPQAKAHVAPGAEPSPAPSAAKPSAAKPPQVAMSRDDGGCTLHRATGDERLAPAACAELKCEPGLVSSFSRARLGVVVGLFFLYFGSTFAWATRWRALLAFAGVKISRRALWRITLEAQAGGILLPGGVAGDALRVGFVVSRGADLPVVLGSVILDRLLGLSTLCGTAAVVAGIFGAGDLGPLVLILGAIPVACVVGLALLRWPRIAQLPIFQRGPLSKIAKPLLDYLGHPEAWRAIAGALGWSLINSAAQLVCLRGLVFALGETPTAERWIYLGTTIAFVVSALPLLPGGIGTSDATFVFFWQKAGIAPSVALAASLLYRVFWYASGGVGAVLYLLRQDGGPERKA